MKERTNEWTISSIKRFSIGFISFFCVSSVFFSFFFLLLLLLFLMMSVVFLHGSLAKILFVRKALKCVCGHVYASMCVCVYVCENVKYYFIVNIKMICTMKYCLWKHFCVYEKKDERQRALPYNFFPTRDVVFDSLFVFSLP